ncbi:hypothetical protein N7495_000090 [Penicillium taxi]|uniref:uncharacterized protein n=1 Tax=Penicillium taxi TaxID=168475 RepID=UPI0025450630|nr:uncharacterized protein N7495_000090 [Penicillium taxi]KAJ5907408.1 hypothetical protein N7495_000090 [Penicillium taxi]
MSRKKAVLIGINYTGSDHQLNGCVNDAKNIENFLREEHGFTDSRDIVILTDEPENEGTPFYPTGANMLAAFKWLVSCNSPGDSLWLSYSGHGSQVRDTDGDRESGYGFLRTSIEINERANRARDRSLDDTICPVDFEQNGQITSGTLHKAIVSPLNPKCRLTILFDCCHSGSAVELPYIYRPDTDGNVSMVNNVKEGVSILREVGDLLHGGFSIEKISNVEDILHRGHSLFNRLKNPEAPSDDSGLADENFAEDWAHEGKDVWMFSGCSDEQTSADTSMQGLATGAMSWAFLAFMRKSQQPSYIEVLQQTRQLLQSKFSQIPQLSVGGKYDINQPVYL